MMMRSTATWNLPHCNSLIPCLKERNLSFFSTALPFPSLPARGAGGCDAQLKQNREKRRHCCGGGRGISAAEVASLPPPPSSLSLTWAHLSFFFPCLVLSLLMRLLTMHMAWLRTPCDMDKIETPRDYSGRHRPVSITRPDAIAWRGATLL